MSEYFLPTQARRRVEDWFKHLDYQVLYVWTRENGVYLVVALCAMKVHFLRLFPNLFAEVEDETDREYWLSEDHRATLLIEGKGTEEEPLKISLEERSNA